MATIINISGYLKEKNNSRPLSGMYVEIYGSGTPSQQQYWMGGGKSDDYGYFSFYLREDTTPDIATPSPSNPLTLVVFYGDHVIHTETISSSNVGIILVPTQHYNFYYYYYYGNSGSPIDPTHEPKEELFFIIEGHVTNQLGQPIPSCQIIAQQNSFNSRIPICRTYSDANGYYRMKIARMSLNSFRSIRVQANGEIESAVDITDFPIRQTVDLKFNYWTSPTFSAAVYNMTEITGLYYISLMADLTTEAVGNLQSDSQLIASATGMDEKAIAACIHTFKIGLNDLGFDDAFIGYVWDMPEYCFLFALVYEKETSDPDTLFSMEKDEIIAILQKAKSQNWYYPYIDEYMTTEEFILYFIRPSQTNIAVNTVIEGEEKTMHEYFSTLEGGNHIAQYYNLAYDYNGSDINSFWGSFYFSGKYDLQMQLRASGMLGYSDLMFNYFYYYFYHLWDWTPEIATFNITQWIDAIESAGGSSPDAAVPQIIKDNSSDPIGDYAIRLKQTLQDIYPARALEHRLNTDATSLIPNSSIRYQISNFFYSNPDFDFRKKNVEDISHWTITNLSEVREALVPFQTLTRITNANNDAIISMMLNGLNSAAAIASISQETFISTYEGTLGGRRAAINAYQTAVKMHASGLQAATGWTLSLNGPSWPWTLNPANPGVANPDLATLFGSLEQCGCSECMSVYSAAAYYVDILNFLRLMGSSVDKPFQELTRRRPDLQYIDITCKNANTALPYIDLLNERLEALVMDIDSIFGCPASYQTIGTAANLAAYPEHMYRVIGDTYEESTAYEQVYNNVLKNALYPFKVPLDLPWEEARVYLQHLGYSRLRLMDMFRPVNGPIPVTGITPYNFFIESAGLPKAIADIISQAHTETNVYKFYGFNSATVTDYISPTDSSITITGNWQQLLKGELTGGGLDVLLYVLDISFGDLQRLLDTDVVNKLKNVSVEPTDECELIKMHLEITGGSTPTNAFFNKIHRVVRLSKAANIGFYELDVLLRAFGVEDINNTDDLFTNIMRSIHLARQLNIPIEQFVTWWAVMDSRRYTNYDSDRQNLLPSVYDRVFLSKSNPQDNAFDPTALSTETYGTNLSGIIAACQIGENDLKLLMSTLGISPTDNMSMVGLTKIFSVATISNSLQIKIKDFIHFAALCGINYGQVSGTPTATHAATQMNQLENLISYADMLKRSGFTLNDVRYILLDQDEQKVYTPEEKVVQPFFESMRAELQKAYVDPATLNPSDPDYPEKKQALDDVLRNVVIQQFAAQFNLEADTAILLVKELYTIGYDSGHDDSYPHALITDALIDPDFIFSEYPLSVVGIDQAMSTYPKPIVNLYELYPLYYRVYKAALICSITAIRREEVRLLQQYCYGLGVLNMGDFPFMGTPSSGPVLDLFLGLIKYVNWIKVRKQFSITPEMLRQLIATIFSGTKQDWIDIVEEITSWSESQITELVGSGSATTTAGLLKVTFFTDFNSPNLLLRMADMITAAKKIGLSPTQINLALESTMTMADARRVRMAARSKYTETDWMKVAKPLQDPLREKQRQALVAYILSHPEKTQGRVWRTENDLYAWLLIDVEMQPCTMTSRIRMALSSVQLYVERVIMNLEYYNQSAITFPLITISPEKVAQWRSWRKWYRIWEANRKVFLYPENWIEPELRDNKTPFFQELETQLLQDEINEKTATEAYLNYLDKLDEVARLEPMTSYHERDTSAGIDAFHVIARTYKEPHVYYYRKFTDGEWTAWERMNLEPKGNHLTLVVWNRRLFVFWLDFIEQQFNDELGNAFIRDMKSKSVTFTNTSVTYRPGAKGKKEQVEKINSDRVAKSKILLDEIGYIGQYPVMWMKTGQLSDFFSNLRDNGMSIENAQSLLLKGWRIRVNWSELKSNKWSAPKTGSDEMMMYPWGYVLSPVARDMMLSIDTKQLQAISDQLQKKNELSINDLFKNRISLQPIINNDGALTLSILLASAPDELSTCINAFRFEYPGAAPKVIREIAPDQLIPDTGSLVSPNGTVLNNNKFVENPFSSGSLQVSDYRAVKAYHSTTDSQNSRPRSYWSGEWIRWGYTDYVNEKNHTILEQTPFGKFRITAKANMYGRNPVYDQFFFEDDNNLFLFYRNTSINSVITEANSLLAYDNTVSSPAAQYSYHLNFVAPVTGILSTNDPTVTISFNTPVEAKFSLTNPVYYVKTFFHPHVTKFIKELNLHGIDGLLNLQMQVQTDTLNFSGNYLPSALVHTPYPTNKVTFEYEDAYSIYNWELFYHIPMLIAQRLSENQQFEQSQKWYHYIFDPTNNTDASGAISTSRQRFWKCRPLYDEAGKQIVTIQDIMEDINKYAAQVTKWEKNPFNPHIIARMRLLAYMKNTVMKYLDNLIAWGDQLFRRDTIESINEATQLYILASNILGRKPQSIPQPAPTNIQNFDELVSSGLDSFSNAVVKIERYTNSSIITPADVVDKTPKMLYFCIPQNDKLMEYWDIVADRLFKIRNCMNIEGAIRQLPLFDPPIDPAMLVRAAAAGVDPGAVLDSIAGIGMPHYRFSFIVQKAYEICQDVKALGSALLSALEKKDAEELSLLRSTHEIALLEHMKSIREIQVQEAEQTVEALKKTREVTEVKYKYYSTRVKVNAGEQQHLKSLEEGISLQARQAILESIAGTIAAIPNFHVQGPSSGTSIGGANFSTITRAAASALGIEVMSKNVRGTMAQVKAGYDRRQDDWDFQTESALKELEQIDKQIIGSEIRLSIARKELDSQILQIENSKATDEYMRSKYTNQELYNWMITQISTVYFQSYQLAFDIAKKAEMCFKQELPEPLYKMPAKGLIQFGYWDSLRKGLMSGEKLQYDLRKMEATYLENNKRLQEMTKHVSLAALDPHALVQLQQTGKASFSLPELLFDLDHPGQYLRRIKAVTITIPGVTGPYTNINAQLTITDNRIRVKTITSDGYAYKGTSDNRFVKGLTVQSYIATSTGQNDSGMFELNFKDERYLPFEGAGAISSWELNFPNLEVADAANFNLRQFNYGTISDVIITIYYTAVYDGTLRLAAEENIKNNINKWLDETASSPEGLWQPLSLRRMFPNVLHTLLHKKESGLYAAEFTIEHKYFPYIFHNQELETDKVLAIIVPKAANSKVEEFTGKDEAIAIEYKDGTWTPFSTTPQAADANIEWGSLPTVTATGTYPISPLTTWKLTIDPEELEEVTINGTELVDGSGNLRSELIEDIIFAIHYSKV